MCNLKNGEITRKYHGFVEVGLLLPVSLSPDKIASCVTCCKVPSASFLNPANAMSQSPRRRI